MSIHIKRALFAIAWILIVISGPYTVLKISPGAEIGMNAFFLNVVQRMLGLLGFSLIFIQIITGAYMKKVVQIIGSKAFILHIVQGLTILAVILLHPLMYYLIGYQQGLLSKYLIISFSDPYELFILAGQTAFILVMTAGLIGYLRTRHLFRRMWRKVHILNYIAFFLIAIHSRGIGTDIRYIPFSIVYMLSIPTVIATVVYKLYEYVTNNEINLLKKFMIISKYGR